MARFTTVKLRDKEYDVYVTKFYPDIDFEWSEGGSEAYNSLNITAEEETSILEQIHYNLYDSFYDD